MVLHRMRVGNEIRIAGEHAVHVGPDFDFFGVDRRAHERRRKIGPAAAERGGNAFVVRRNKTAHHGDMRLADV